ncbi:potassium transporter 26-like [Salvia miltiorrhiza]|uniref:potassium transporter 26-like n=1 Tax=Salvia miltiorrhiza TaxID=226208 RepID=UPI0025AC3213|nr:potassium transporter 26-like [Salvia miltiorrhiza]
MDDNAANNFISMNSDPENGGGGGGGGDLSGGQVEGREADMDSNTSFTKFYDQPPQREKIYSSWENIVLAYQSLGVVYGDLGTSPVNVFSATSFTNLTEEDLLGILSLIIWTLTSLVLIKYVLIVLHANDHGEGGTFALYSYICRHMSFKSKFTIQNTRLESHSSMAYYSGGSPLSTRAREFLERSSSAQNFLTLIVLLGTCMVIGDGALTPATCVLSALQGIQSRSSKITQGHVVWISVVVLVALFLFQRCGTSKVSFLFSPIMCVWFATNVSIGVYNILKYHPSILKAVSPHYIVKFFMANGRTAWDLLGAVFLSITGAEAMFADLGHFNKRAIQLGFSFVVYPSLIVTYAGETAYLVKHPENIMDAYYSSIPNPIYWPMFVISTLAAVVASQSMISACFSIVKQSLALGCFPRVLIIHTSSKHPGQVYSPEINYILLILTVALVVGFKGGVELANAYGVVVIWVMIITTFLTSLVMLVIWKASVVVVLGFLVPYILIEGAFMSSLLRKIPQGGWVPFAVSVLFMTVMLSWTYGRSKKTTYEAENKMSVAELDDALSGSSICRTPGICFFFTDLVYGIPPIIRRYIHHTNSVREIMVVVTIRTLPIKTVAPEKRLHVGKLGHEGVYRCLIQFGYKDAEDMDGAEYADSIVAKLVELIDDTSEEHKIQSAMQKGIAFVTGRTILKANNKSGMLARFTIDYLYRFLQKNSRPAVSTFQTPSEATLQVGMLYEI